MIHERGVQVTIYGPSCRSDISGHCQSVYVYSFSINILKSLEGCILATLLKIALDEDIICVNVPDEIPRGLKVSPQSGPTRPAEHFLGQRLLHT